MYLLFKHKTPTLTYSKRYITMLSFFSCFPNEYIPLTFCFWNSNLIWLSVEHILSCDIIEILRIWKARFGQRTLFRKIFLRNLQVLKCWTCNIEIKTIWELCVWFSFCLLCFIYMWVAQLYYYCWVLWLWYFKIEVEVLFSLFLSELPSEMCRSWHHLICTQYFATALFVLNFLLNF